MAKDHNAAGTLQIIGKLESTPQELKDFTDSFLHRDFQRICDDSIEFLRDELEDAGNKHVGKTYDILRGAIFNLRTMRTVFIDMIEDLEERNKQLNKGD